jgi:serine protease AprX
MGEIAGLTPFSTKNGSQEASEQAKSAANSYSAHNLQPASSQHVRQAGANTPSPSASPDAGGSDNQAQIAAKMAPDLQGLDPKAPVDVIVQYNKTAPTSDLTSLGATEKAELPLIHAQLVNTTAGNLATLASQGNVAYISPNRTVKGALNHLVTAVNGDLAHAAGWNGTGIGIAVIDSGVSQRDDLNSDGNQAPSRVVYNQSFVPGDTTTADAFGHGTHVAGIISGNSYDSATLYTYPGVYLGMAPEADIINLRVLDSNGSATDSTIIAAVQQAIALQSTYNIRVINMSLGRPVFESYAQDPLCQAVEAAWQAGIVVVVSAGNDGEDNSFGSNGYATIGAPGNDPYVITVGATNTHGTGNQTSQTMTSYSSKGPTGIDHFVKPDLVAPGNHIISLKAPNNALLAAHPTIAVYPCDPTGTICNSTYGPPRYMILSGTSMATPAVSGAVALLLQQNPSMTPDQVKARLMKTAWKGFSPSTSATDLGTGTVYTIEQDIFTIGAGALDIEAALNSTDLAPAAVGSAMSPTANYGARCNCVYVVPASNSIWGSSVVWGNSLVWGNSVLSGTTASGNSVVWSNSVVWGNSSASAFSVVWGNSVVWSNSVVWGNSVAWGNSVVWGNQ